MRNKNFDADLLKTLNEQPMPAAPLTDDEFARVLDAACAKLPQAKKTVKRRFPWGRVAAAAAACVAVGLGSVNFAAPAVAEQLPVVGSLFSWLNRGGQDDYVSLQSEQLNKYAETVEATAETADSPYTLTLGQVFNDGDWLRISLMLTERTLVSEVDGALHVKNIPEPTPPEPVTRPVELYINGELVSKWDE